MENAGTMEEKALLSYSDNKVSFDSETYPDQWIKGHKTPRSRLRSWATSFVSHGFFSMLGIICTSLFFRFAPEPKSISMMEVNEDFRLPQTYSSSFPACHLLSVIAENEKSAPIGAGLR